MACGKSLILINVNRRLKMNDFSEWDPKNYRPQETHVQAVSRRVHSSRENRKYLHQKSVRSSDIRPRRIIEVMHRRDSRAGSGRRQVLGSGK